MTKKVVTVSEDDDIEKVAELMVERDINRIPVLKEGKLSGIIGRADVVRYIAKTME
jgi:CBS domain-containing protein